MSAKTVMFAGCDTIQTPGGPGVRLVFDLLTKEGVSPFETDAMALVFKQVGTTHDIAGMFRSLADAIEAY